MTDLHEILRPLEEKYKMFNFHFETNTLSYIGPDDYQKVNHLVMLTSELENLELGFYMDDDNSLVVYS